MGSLDRAISTLERHLDQPDEEGEGVTQALEGLKELKQAKERALER